MKSPILLNNEDETSKQALAALGSEENPYDCSSKAYAKLYNFYSQDPTRIGELFVISEKVSVGEYIPSNAISLFSEFGIRSSYMRYQSNCVAKCLLIIPAHAMVSAAELESFIASRSLELQQQLEADNEEFLTNERMDCVIEMTKQSQIDLCKMMLACGREAELANMIDLLSLYKCYNLYLYTGQISRRKRTPLDNYKKYECNGVPLFRFVLVDDLLAKYNCFTQNYYTNAKNITELVNEFRTLAKSNSLFYADILDVFDDAIVCEKCHAPSADTLASFWCKVAAYCTMAYSMKFCIPDGFSDVFTHYCAQMHSRLYCHCGDYLKMLQNIPEISVKLSPLFNSYAYLNKNMIAANPRLYNIRVAYQYYELDNSGWRIEHANSPLADLEIIDINSVCQMNTTDVNTAVQNSAKLKSLLQRFDTVQDNQTSTFDCTNTFAFRKDGKTCIALLKQLSGKLPFIMTPVDGKLNAFKVDLDVTQLERLQDVRVLFSTIYMKKVFDKLCGRETKQSEFNWYLPETSIGLMFLNEEILPGVSDNITPVKYDTLGLWNPVSLQLRGNLSDSKLTTVIPLKGLKREYLTYYGGPVPCRNTDLFIREELWR